MRAPVTWSLLPALIGWCVRVTGIDEHRWVPRRVGPDGLVTRIIDLTPGHERAADPATLAQHLVRLTEHPEPLPPRIAIGLRAAALTLAMRLLPASRVESLVAWWFGLTDKTACAQ